MVYTDEEYLALSGIQHFTFCRRQWALIHIERIWEDNLLTVQGELMHERAHNGGLREHRGDTIIVRGLTVHSAELGVWGKCDVVEFHRVPDGHPLPREDGLWTAFPVEYKHGRSKADDSDRLQLCAQAMCLEEMLASRISHGHLYYGSTRSRERVDFDGDLRKEVIGSFQEMHRLFDARHTPKVKRHAGCTSCSLKDVCMPKVQNSSVMDYITRSLGDSS